MDQTLGAAPPRAAVPEAHANDGATDPRHELELLRLLAAGIGPALFGTVAVSAMVAGLLWNAVPGAMLAAWFVYQMAVVVARTVHLLRFRRQPPEEQRALGFYLGIVASGLGWGAMSLFVPVLEDPAYRAMIVIAAAGVTGGSASTYAALLPLVRLFLGLTLIPIALPFLLAGGRVDVVLGMMLVCYLLVMWRNAGNMHAGLAENVRLRFEHVDVADQLRLAQGRSAALNQDLRSKLTQLEATQGELVRAKDTAESAAAAKAEFLANMSHEIRTPMNGVLGMAELLLGTPLSKRQTQLADTIHRSGRQLLSVINDILDFSKIEAGKLEISREPFDVRDLVEDIGEIFSETAHKRGLELVCDVPPELTSSRLGDADRLRQVLTNLVSNAIKFTEHGEVVISVSGEPAEGDVPVLRFMVRDSGIGIASEHQARIFDSFTQADGSTTRRFGGTGLGLAICRQLTELMGGTIGLDSTPTRGSTFWFTCPLEVVDVARVPGRHRQAALARASIADMPVLVLGKDDTSRELMVATLSSWGAWVSTCETANAALQALREAAGRGQPFKAVVFSRELPDMPAAQFTQGVRGDSRLGELRLVMLTTVANLESTGELLASGVSAYLTRPVRQRELYAAVSAGAQGLADLERTQGEAAPGAYQARVLVVEDNAVNQELARCMLESLGCEVRVVDNGREAVEAITDSPLDALREPYDLVLMDCQMPVLDGYGATREIRAWEREQGTTALPIVALTANALEGDRERCLEAGMDDYLAKPFTRDEINQVLGNWLAAAPVSSAMKTAAAPAAPSRQAVVSSGASPLDADVLARITALQRDGSPDLLGRLVGLFLANAAQLLTDLEQGLAASDGERVRRAVHTLKSSSANLGATALACLAGELEAAARDGHLDEVAKRLDVLHFEMDGVIAALRELRPQEA